MGAEQMINKSRLRWLDALKGFAILTVVYLHVHNGYEYEGTFDGEIVKWITSFHMALFFATAGFCFSYEVSNYKQKIQRKLKSLMVPYLVWGVIIGFFVENIRVIIHPQSFDAIGMIFPIITGKTSYLAGWFLLVLFLVYMLEYLISAFYNGKDLVLVGVHALCGIAGYFMNDIWGGYYRIRLVLISSTFFVLGFFLKKYWHKVNGKPIAISTILFFILGLFFELKNTRVTYSKEIFGNPILAFSSAVFTIAALFEISYRMESVFKNCAGRMFLKSLCFFGENSIVVLCTHLLFLYVIRILEKVLGMQIHTFPVGGAFLIVVMAEIILIKLMPRPCWKLFGK